MSPELLLIVSNWSNCVFRGCRHRGCIFLGLINCPMISPGVRSRSSSVYVLKMILGRDLKAQE